MMPANDLRYSMRIQRLEHEIESLLDGCSHMCHRGIRFKGNAGRRKSTRWKAFLVIAIGPYGWPDQGPTVASVSVALCSLIRRVGIPYGGKASTDHLSICDL